MEKLRNRIKNVKGITLISLVITIIVLIILAGVALNMLLGENGIISRTKIAKEENEKATATETMNLKITNVQISKYAEEQRMPTLKELADNFCEDNDFQYVQETSEIASLTKITNNNPTSIYTKLKAYPYEFEINSSLQLASIDGIKVATVPVNDDDTIVSMTKAELQDMINTAVNSKMNKYSTTTEQVIGTWIDGKPIYQKTYMFNNNTTIPNNSWYVTNFSSADIDQIVGGRMYSDSGSYNVEVGKENNNIILLTTRYDGAYAVIKSFTIQYTKTESTVTE